MLRVYALAGCDVYHVTTCHDRTVITSLMELYES
jgi:hypothetical protein